MEALHQYLTDCEGKRRRMRNRPSDAVLTELRRLLDEFRSAGETDDPTTRATPDGAAHTTDTPPTVGA